MPDCVLSFSLAKGTPSRRPRVELSFAWLSRFRRLTTDYERLPETVAGLHLVAFSILMLGRVMTLLMGESA